jgi:hypothetical protein
MKKRIFAFLISIVLLLVLTTGASAQDYSFRLAKEVVHVYISDQGQMRVDYALTFSNNAGASPIDFVDVGLPNNSYTFSSISADLDGKASLGVSSDYQGDGCCGVAIELGNYAIQPGRSGTVNVRIGTIERMLFTDSTDSNYASFQFSPTWFGSQYVSGSTDITVIFHLPPGVQSEEPRWHEAPYGFPAEPETGFDDQGRITYTWRNTGANGSTQYTFGASFPKKYVPASAITQPSIWETLGINPDDLVGFGFMCCFGLLFFGSPILGAVQASRRKLQYLPPKISIEGHGIKRGLTAVEAAILMGQPLDKVMTMILFGVIKKEAVQVEKKNPLTLSFANPMVQGLREYEEEFITAFRENDAAKRRRLLQTMTVNLVKSVTEKMKGFSRNETIEYYKSINEKAWNQISAAGTPEVQSQMFEEALEWTMLDKDYDDRARRTFTGPVFIPTWWGRYDPIYRGSPRMSTPVSIPTGGSGGRGSLPGADFAASVVGGVQNFAGGVIGNLSDFTNGVTNVTNPPPPPARSSGGGGRSGGGCACACACAGCACACAGGGR